MGQFLDFATNILNYIWMTLQGLANLLLLVPKAMHVAAYSAGFLPAEIRAFAITALFVSIVFLLLGR